MQPEPYPVEFSVEYPDRPLNRLTTFFRIFMAIPILIVLGTVSGGSWGPWGGGGGDDHNGGGYSGTGGMDNGWDFGGLGFIGGAAGGLLFFAPLLLILFRHKYPRWWFDWNLELLRFINRVGVYLALMDDRYPSTDEHQAVRLDIPYPDARRQLNRWLPLVKWLLAIPHYIILFFLDIAALIAIIITWFAVLFTGRYPRGLFDFVEGVLRWHNRVTGYAFILVTDRYPPFRLSP